MEDILPRSLDALEIFEVDRQQLDPSPFARRLFSTLSSAHRIIGEPAGDTQFLVWGGLAANILLCATKRCSFLYSTHDLELLPIVDGKIAYESAAWRRLCEHMERRLGLKIGAERIAIRTTGRAVRSFRAKRMLRKDGDLEMNQIDILFTLDSPSLEISAPRGLVGGVTARVTDYTSSRGR